MNHQVLTTEQADAQRIQVVEPLSINTQLTSGPALIFQGFMIVPPPELLDAPEQAKFELDKWAASRGFTQVSTTNRYAKPY